MTAIAGWIGSSPDTSQRNIQALLDGLSIYGTAAPQFNTLGPAAFGRSLTPTLPEDDPREPPLIGGGKVMLAADVRIDNRSELIARLGTDAARAAAQSDSALLLEAWLKWGEQCLDHIVGDFALAIWDDERRQLIMARDATGQRPLFFATTDTASVASPEGASRKALAARRAGAVASTREIPRRTAQPPRPIVV